MNNNSSRTRFPRATAAFRVPDLLEAMELFERLGLRWASWLEDGPDGTFVVLLTPERISELDELLGLVEEWLSEKPFAALPFHLDGRDYIMQRSGVIGPADRPT